ncbi:MAG: hypothetical protein R3279_13980, partial [Putridiphycobacter sp.]|nr:hypothetical protein [Putridiphycobacter sp.]
MSLKSITLAISLSICVLAIGQYDLEKATKDSVSTIKRDRYISALKQNIYVGSGFNLLLGNQLSVYASPQIGYEFLPNFSAGFLGLMHYYQDPFYRQSAFG